MSGAITTVITLGVVLVGGYFLWTHKDEIFAQLNTIAAPSKTPTASADVTPIKGAVPVATAGDKYNATDNTLGPGNFGDEGPDQGYGFAKSGGPVGPNGTAANGQPRAGDNSNSKNLTIASLPGPCETALYKGMIQYKHAGLSASADTCTHAKQYFLYKYGTGGTGSSGVTAAKTGKGKGKTTAIPKGKTKKGHYAHAYFTHRLSI